MNEISQGQAILARRLKAYSFVWLLFCFFAMYYYTEHSSLRELPLRIFVYGIFAAPVWITMGWTYLHVDRVIPRKWMFLITAAYAFWAFIEWENGQRYHNNKEWLVIASATYFWLTAHYCGLTDLFARYRLKKALKTPKRKLPASQSTHGGEPSTTLEKKLECIKLLTFQATCDQIANMLEDMADRDFGRLEPDEVLMIAARNIREMPQNTPEQAKSIKV